MIKLIIKGTPIPWAAPKLSKHRTYDIRANDKRTARIQIKKQYKAKVINSPVLLHFFFEMPIPKGTSQKKIKLMLSREIEYTGKSDVTNCQKLYEDCLKKTVIFDDRLVYKVISEQYYSLTPQTIIFVYPKENLNAV